MSTDNTKEKIIDIIIGVSLRTEDCEESFFNYRDSKTGDIIMMFDDGASYILNPMEQFMYIQAVSLLSNKYDENEILEEEDIRQSIMEMNF